MNNSSLLQFKVNFYGTIHHRPKERHACPIQHQKHCALQKQLKNTKSYIKYRENLDALRDEQFVSGQGNDCSPHIVLRNIRSKAKKEYKKGESEIKGLLELQ